MTVTDSQRQPRLFKRAHQERTRRSTMHCTTCIYAGKKEKRRATREKRGHANRRHNSQVSCYALVTVLVRRCCYGYGMVLCFHDMMLRCAQEKRVERSADALLASWRGRRPSPLPELRQSRLLHANWRSYPRRTRWPLVAVTSSYTHNTRVYLGRCSLLFFPCCC